MWRQPQLDPLAGLLAQLLDAGHGDQLTPAQDRHPAGQCLDLRQHVAGQEHGRSRPGQLPD
jgi:hypothetical protein